MLWWLALLGLALAEPIEDQLDAGREAWARGDLATALTEWTDGLALAREAGDKNAEAELLLRLAAVHRGLGRVETVERALAEAQALSDDPVHAARVTQEQGLLSLAVGRPRRAAKQLEQAFAALQRAQAPVEAGAAALNLGLARQASGDLIGARKAYEGARTLFAALQSPADEGDALLALSRLDARAGALRAARAGVSGALQRYEQGQSQTRLAEAQALLGELLVQLGQPAQARAAWEAGLQTARSQRQVGQQARLLALLAELDAAHAPDQAITQLEAAAAAYRSVQAEAAALAIELRQAQVKTDLARVRRIADTARQHKHTALLAEANLVLAEHSPREAERLLAEARPHIAERHELRWRERWLAGRVARAKGDSDGAIAALTEAVDLLELTRASLASSEVQGFIAQHEALYQELIDLLLLKGEPLQALAYGQRLQLSELDVQADPKTQAVLDEQRWLQQRAHDADTQVSPEQSAALAERIAEQRVAFASAVDQLRSATDGFSGMVRIDPEDLEAAQRQLPADTAVVQPLVLPDRVVLLVFTREALDVRTTEIDAATVLASVKKLSRSLQAGHTRDPDWTNALADELGSWFWAPMADIVETHPQLVFTTTGPLRELPMAALRQDGAYLAQVARVAHITHIGSVTQNAPKLRLAGPDLLVVGNPDGSLPGAAKEAATLAKRFPDATQLVGDQASIDAFKTAATGKTVVHLATHGVLDRSAPDHSYLVLYGDPLEAGHLGYREIPGLAADLSQARLIVLSACQSSLPVQRRGPPPADEEGVVTQINGLSAQFRRAGVETLVGSLWKVDDDATLALMDAFYAALAEGKDVASALNHAQQTLAGQPDTAHPWYWAAFVVVGDWR